MTKLTLSKFPYPQTWGGERLDKSAILKLRVGDHVRICFDYENGGWAKHYVQITRIDRYKYGGIHKPRKFVGKLKEIYSGFTIWTDVSIGDIISFQPSNILEIPGWGDKPDQSNATVVELSRDIMKIKYNRDCEVEYDKEDKNAKEMYNDVRELSKQYGIIQAELKRRLAKHYHLGSKTSNYRGLRELYNKSLFRGTVENHCKAIVAQS